MYVCMKPNPGGQIFNITTNYIYKLLFYIIHLKKEFPKGQNSIDPYRLETTLRFPGGFIFIRHESRPIGR